MSAKKGPSHVGILIGLIAGGVLGVTLNALLAGKDGLPPWLGATLTYVIDPVGKIFMNLLIMTVVPLVFCSLSVGVAKLGDLGKLGRIGARTMGFFAITTSTAVVIGLLLVNTIRPGVGLPDDVTSQLAERFGGEAKTKLDKGAGVSIDTFVNIVPRNPLQAAVELQLLGVIFFALLVGIGMTRIDPQRGKTLMDVFEAIGEVMVFIIHLAMKMAPLGVFCLIFGTTARFGFGLLQQLGMYVVVVLIGLAIQMFVVFPVIIKTLGRMSPIDFYRRAKLVPITGFSTSSSNATLPTAIEVATENLGVKREIGGFVLPLGATMNMNGTALFEGVTVLFLAQVFGQNVSLPMQLLVVLMSVVTAIGAAGVPGGSLPLIGMVLTVVHVDPGAIALILGVDRFLDMCRTAVNVTGDVTAAVVINRYDGDLIGPPPTLPPIAGAVIAEAVTNVAEDPTVPLVPPV